MNSSLNDHDSVVNLLTSTGSSTVRYPLPRPPSTPKPPDKRNRTRRASSVSLPYKPSSKTSISGSTSQNPVKRKSSVDLSSSVDFSGRNLLDLREELNQVCKTLRETITEKDELSHEIVRLKKVVNKKEKEVEDLLIGGYVGQKDRSRLAGATSKHDTLMALSSLRHRIHILERNFRLKEEELAVLRRDIKTTRLKELEIEKEVYYSEVNRLQIIVDKLKLELNADVPQSKKHMRKQLEEQGRAIKRMKEKINSMSTDLITFKEQLGLWKKGRATVDEHETDERKCLFSKYLKLKQGELISRLMNSETRVQDVEGEMDTLVMKHREEIGKYDGIIYTKSEEISGLKSQLVKTESKLNDIQIENNTLQHHCTEYRALVEKARLDLSETTENLNSLQTDKDQLEMSLSELQEGRKNREEKGCQVHLVKDEQLAIKKRKEREQQAALTIQNTWRHHVSYKKQKVFDQDNAMIARGIQSVLRGHKTRTNLMRQEDDSAVILLQSIIRGHRTRQRF